MGEKLTNKAPSKPMIGMAGQDGQRAISLFGGHDSRELMRPGHGAEGDHTFRLGAQVGVQPVRPADDENIGRFAAVASRRDVGGEIGAGERLAALVAKNNPGAFGENGANRARLLILAIFRPARASFVEFAKIDAANSNGARHVDEPLGVALEQLALRAGLETADRYKEQTQGASP
jgi:hypothetical protein